MSEACVGDQLSAAAALSALACRERGRHASQIPEGLNGPDLEASVVEHFCQDFMAQAGAGAGRPGATGDRAALVALARKVGSGSSAA